MPTNFPEPEDPSSFDDDASSADDEVISLEFSELTAITSGFERVFGPCQTVLHELVSDYVHVDVYPIPPSPAHPYWVLHTTGMSARPMKSPPEFEHPLYAEVMLKLPPDWPVMSLDAKLPEQALERTYWPIRWLKTVARLPHEYDTWIGPGHTVPNGDPPEPFADDTDFCCIIAGIPREEQLQSIVLPKKEVRILNLAALYPEEVGFVLKNGSQSLFEKFDEAGISDVITPHRRSVVS